MAVKKILHILFFTILMVLKVSAAPIYFDDCHEDEHTDDCELCEHVIQNQNTEFYTPPQFKGIEIDSLPTLHQDEIYYKSVDITTPINNLHFGRPPPIN